MAARWRAISAVTFPAIPHWCPKICRVRRAFPLPTGSSMRPPRTALSSRSLRILRRSSPSSARAPDASTPAGSPASAIYTVVGVCGVWEHAGIVAFDELFTKEVLVGAGGAGSAGPLSQFPTALRRLLGVNLKVIQGYRGSAEIRLALARGELHGICGLPLSTLKTEWRDDFAAGRFKILLQLGRERSTELPGIPHVYEYSRTAEDRQVFDLIFGLQAMGRPFAAPPNVPAERVAALRAAFMAMANDPAFRA